MRLGLLALIIGVIAACAPQQQASVRLVGEAVFTATPHIIFVTPTPAPTMIPTLEITTPTFTPSPTPRPSATPDAAAQAASCEAQVVALYTAATELCLGKPEGFICNGGSAPQTEPSGPLANALANTGSTVEAALFSKLRTTPLNEGGLLYVRLGEGIRASALMIGEVELTNTTPPGFPAWKNFTVQTFPTASDCPNAGVSALILQGGYGQRASVVVNGVSLDVSGTVAIFTQENTTRFLSIEGLLRLIVNGTAYSLFAGEEVDVYYNGDWRSPQRADAGRPLTWELIQHLPVVLLDRPVLLPQPGYVETRGNVNMRAAPSDDARLLYQVPAGQVLDVLGQNEDGRWFHVRLGNGETGWMLAELLRQNLGEIVLTYEQTPIPPQRFGALGSSGRVTAAQGANLRRGPDTFFDTLMTLPAGTQLELVARSPYSPWVRVRASGAEGWLSLITLETRSVIAFLPVDYSAPLPPRPTATPVFQFGGGHAYPNPLGGQ
jgi:uncharacterized protein YraI